MIKETLPFHLYELRHEKRSRLDPTYMLSEVYGFKCPKCKAEVVNHTLDHGNKYTCECGLIMVLNGNALTCFFDDEAQ